MFFTYFLQAPKFGRPTRICLRRRKGCAFFQQLGDFKDGSPNALTPGMSTSALSTLSNLSSSYLQSILGTALNAVGLSPNQSSSASSSAQQPDSGQLSPFTQLLSTLQQLQTSNPTEYQQITQQIATNLQTAAQTATTQGNTAAAAQLTQLSNDFTQASQNGQLPSVSDLAQAIGGHHHHGHHHFHAESS